MLERGPNFIFQRTVKKEVIMRFYSKLTTVSSTVTKWAVGSKYVWAAMV